MWRLHVLPLCWGLQLMALAAVLLDLAAAADTSGNHFKGCPKPMERPESLYEKCWSDDGSFPAHHVTCRCSECPLVKINMTCSLVGGRPAWDTSEFPMCMPKPPLTRCGQCRVADLPADVRCPATKRPGKAGESASCYCRTNCLSRDVRCHADKTWRYVSDEDACLDTPGTVSVSERVGLNVWYANGTYTHTCRPGFTLVGPARVRCQDGLLEGGKLSSCVPSVPPQDEMKNIEVKIETTEANYEETEELSTSSSETISENSTLAITATEKPEISHSSTSTIVIASLSAVTCAVTCAVGVLWCRSRRGNRCSGTSVVYMAADQMQRDTDEFQKDMRPDEFQKDMHPDDFQKDPDEFQKNMRPDEFQKNMRPDEFQKDIHPGEFNLEMSPTQHYVQMNAMVKPKDKVVS